MTISAEEIAAYVDGELDEAARSRVMLAALADMELADRIAAQRALRETLKAHFAPVGEAPVPDAWAQMIRQEIAPAKVVNIADARKRRFGAAPWVGMAVAASLALGVFVGTRLQQGPIVERDGALVASGDLAHALDTQLASTQGDAPVQMLGTFRRSGGGLCRVFSGAAAAGIACHANDGWRLQHVVPGTQEQNSAYRQAGSGQARLMALAQEMAAGDPLDAAQESAARSGHWR
jgi:hypothetical protein